MLATAAAAESTVKVGDLIVNLTRQRVYYKANQVLLTPMEFQIMELLAARKGTFVTKEMILNKLYPHGNEPEMKTIDIFISKMRRKIKRRTGGRDYIHTLWGRGYALADDPGELVA